MWGHYDGGGWWMVTGILMMAVFWGGIAAVFYLLVGPRRSERQLPEGGESKKILDRRFAAGEIDENEYDRVRERLSS